MTTLKPVRMWAVCTYKGVPCVWTLRLLRREAIDAMVQERRQSWDNLKKLGYTIRRVTITPDPESESEKSDE